MLKRNAVLTTVVGLLALSLSAFPREQAGSFAGEHSNLLIGVQMAKMNNRFVLALLHDSALDPNDLSGLMSKVMADKRIARHVVTVTTSVNDDPEAEKLALGIAYPAKPAFPEFVFITPTADGLSEDGTVSGALTESLLKTWLVEHMCGALAKKTPGAPEMDSDLASLCADAAGRGPLSPGGNAPQPRPMAPEHLPLTNAEADLTQKVTRQTPHLKGTWKGTASRFVCGEAQSPVEVALTLDDDGYRLPNAYTVGNVSGKLTVGGDSQGIIAADYGSGRLQTNPIDTMTVQLGNLNLLHPAAAVLSPYYVKFSARDAWAGLGYYQTLSGAMFRESATSCPNYGSLGEVLKVDLKKQ